VQTIQNTGNITGNFRSSVGRCCTSPLVSNTSDSSSCGAASAIASTGADIMQAVAPGSSFTFVMPIGAFTGVNLLLASCATRVDKEHNVGRLRSQHP